MKRPVCVMENRLKGDKQGHPVGHPVESFPGGLGQRMAVETDGPTAFGGDNEG